MAIIYAATGILRAQENTKTPLVITSIAAVLNLILNYIFIYIFNLSLTGSALGTFLCQGFMVSIYFFIFLRQFRADHVGLLPNFDNMKSLLGTGSWLIIRTICLRLSLWGTVFFASLNGNETIAANHILMNIWSFLAFALDSFAIAAQVLVSQAIGGQNRSWVKQLIKYLSYFSALFGIILGAVVIIFSPLITRAFTSDTHIIDLAAPSLIIIGVAQSLASFVFLCDGILIGADDSKYLAMSSALTLVVYTITLYGTHTLTQQWSQWLPGWGYLFILWFVFTLVFMGMRALTLGYRIYSPKQFTRWA